MSTRSVVPASVPPPPSPPSIITVTCHHRHHRHLRHHRHHRHHRHRHCLLGSRMGRPTIPHSSGSFHNNRRRQAHGNIVTPPVSVTYPVEDTPVVAFTKICRRLCITNREAEFTRGCVVWLAAPTPDSQDTLTVLYCDGTAESAITIAIADCNSIHRPGCRCNLLCCC